MKAFRMLVAVVLAVTVLLGVGALTVSAVGPAGSSPSNAVLVDNQVDTIAANSSLWYRFDYQINTITGVKPATTLTLVNGTNSGVGFEIWAPNQINDMADNVAIGQGTALNIDCNTGEVSGSGGCQSPDLIWTGQFGANGTYYVQVNNTNAAQAQFKLVIVGDGVKLAPQAALAPKAANALPLKPTGNSPMNSLTFDNQRDTIAANASLWYHFNYAINSVTGEHPATTLTLVNGTNSGLSFEIWAPNQINDMASNQPIGQGTAANIDCNTGEVSGSGGCQSVNLTWVGQFGANGTYFVQVNNTNSAAMSFNLTVNGSGVTLTP